jgi:opacity protein-like surface antigen
MVKMKFCLPQAPIVLSFFMSSLGSLGQGTSQEPVISEREFRFREVEQRALDLSHRLSEITGTAPVQLIDRNQSFEPVRYRSSAQSSFDALPGPLQNPEPLLLPEEEKEEAKPESIVFASQVNRVVPTSQQRKGDYFIMPMFGLAFSGKTKWEDDVDTFTLNGDFGNTLGVEIGRRWDNWVASVMVSYQYLDFEDISYVDSLLDDQNRLESNEESYSISASLGYAIPITERFSHNGGLGVGLAWRRNFIQRSTYIDIPGDSYWRADPATLLSSLVFTYELSLGFEYLFVNNFSGYFGYRVMGLSSNKSFEGAFQHLIEFGVGANF